MSRFVEGIFLQVIQMSAIASLLFLAFLLLQPFFQRKQSYLWQDTLLKGILLSFLLPYTLFLTPLFADTSVGKMYLSQKAYSSILLADEQNLTALRESQKKYEESLENTPSSPENNENPSEATATLPETSVTVEYKDTSPVFSPNMVISIHEPTGYFSILSKIWLFVTVLLSFWYSYCHFLFSKEEKIPLDLDCPLPVYLQENLHSPVLSGLFRSKILLPSQDCLPYFSYISLHEETHHRRKDVFFKLLLLFVKIIHWYNPLVYYFSKVLEDTLELACDQVATKNMDFQEKKNYGFALLSVAQEGKKHPTLCLGFSHRNIGNQLKRRVENMMKPMKKSSKIITALSILLILSALSGFALLGMKSTMGDFIQFHEPTPEQKASPEGANAVAWLSEYRFTMSDDMAETLVHAPQIFLAEDGRYLITDGDTHHWQGSWVFSDHTNDEYAAQKKAVVYFDDQFSMPRLVLDVTTDTWLIASKSEFLQKIHPDLNTQTLYFHGMTPFSQEEWNHMNETLVYPEEFYHQPYTQGMGEGLGLWDEDDGLTDYLYVRNNRSTESLRETLDYERLVVSFQPAMDTLRASVIMQDQEVFSAEEIQTVIDAVQALERSGETLVLASISGYYGNDKLYLYHEEGINTGHYAVEVPSTFAEENIYWHRSINLQEGGKASMNFTQGWIHPCYGIYRILDDVLYFFDDIGDGVTPDFIFEITDDQQLVFLSERENNREYVLEGEEKLETGDIFHFIPVGEEAPVEVGDPLGFSTEANEALTNVITAVSKLLDSSKIQSSFSTVGKKVEADLILPSDKAEIEKKLEEILLIVEEYESDVFSVASITDEKGNVYYSRDD